LKTKKPAGKTCGHETELAGGLSAVVADGFDRAAFLGFLAAGFLVGILRLLEDKGVTSVVVAFEIVGSGFAAEIAVNALIVHVKFAACVFGIFVCYVSHK
jgi:hypothetical protein